MFTGIVEELGTLTSIVPAGDGGESALLAIEGPLVAQDAVHGASIAVNGVCLTVVTADAAGFTADAMAETMRRSNLGALEPGAPVNLERPLRMGDRLGGHLVQGHVDGVGTILRRESADRWDAVEIGLPPDLARYVVEKGSIAVDGVSLTVTAVGDDRFGVGLIPTTLELTTLGRKGAGDTVNLEVDVMGKYVERLAAHTAAPR
ncbi:riboflavin synthase [Allonocardiopsis opalescens]|uniref:Riboflavin synthase n=1 Tax=Allonocardiopsis opalescens TaxID=1144618 RepID=A0A2T0Q3Q6_9ACTN|nr:riboflavin synthase [Allonocardiopsis opalescens]PRX98439.1 riboflavin synthase alpha chain [Allonocardiopsis opalescens]